MMAQAISAGQATEGSATAATHIVQDAQAGVNATSFLAVLEQATHYVGADSAACIKPVSSVPSIEPSDSLALGQFAGPAASVLAISSPALKANPIRTPVQESLQSRSSVLSSSSASVLIENLGVVFNDAASLLRTDKGLSLGPPSGIGAQDLHLGSNLDGGQPTLTSVDALHSLSEASPRKPAFDVGHTISAISGKVAMVPPGSVRHGGESTPSTSFGDSSTRKSDVVLDVLSRPPNPLVSAPVLHDASTTKSIGAKTTVLSRAPVSHQKSIAALQDDVGSQVQTAVPLADVKMLSVGGTSDNGLLHLTANEAVNIIPKEDALQTPDLSGTSGTGDGPTRRRTLQQSGLMTQKNEPNSGNSPANSSMVVPAPAMSTSVLRVAEEAPAALPMGTVNDGVSVGTAAPITGPISLVSHVLPSIASFAPGPAVLTVAGLSAPGGAHLQAEASAHELRHTMLSATPVALEVGVSTGTHGWLKIRAELDNAGQVNASLTGTSSVSTNALRNELSALTSFLETEKIQVGGLIVHTTTHASGLVSQETILPFVDAARSAITGQSDVSGGTGSGSAHGQAGAQSADTGSGAKGREDAPGSTSKAITDFAAYERESGSDGIGHLPSVEYGVGGGWLNVRA